MVEISDKSTVITLDEVASSPLELVKLKSITGGLSLSLIVTVCTTSVPRVALVGLDKVTIIVSSTSSAESSTIDGITIVPLVAPESMVKVPADNE